MSATADIPAPGELNSLLVRTAAGDRAAFAEVYRRTSARLLGVCVRTVWQRAGSFDPTRAGAMTWLVALVRNKAIDRLRQHRIPVTHAADALEAIPDEDSTPAQRAERSEEYRRLEQCMDELAPNQRSSIREAFFSGLTYSVLAERARVPLGTLKSWIRRGLLQLRACLET